MLSNSRIAASRSLDNADAAVVALNAVQASTSTLAGTVSVPTAPDTIVKRDGTGGIAVNGLTSTDTTINGNLTVNGTATYIHTTNFDVQDKNITLNKGGAASSAGGAGISFEENGDATNSYMRIAATRDVIELKAPTSGVMTLNQSLTTLDTPTFAGLASNGAISVTSGFQQLKLTPSVTNAEASILFNTSSTGTGGTPWTMGLGSYSAGTGNLGIGNSTVALILKMMSTGAISTPYNFNAGSLTSNTFTGGSTVDLFSTSSTINAACGSGVQTLNVGVSGGGATAINLGGSNDTVTLGGTTAANGQLSVTSLFNQIKVYPSVSNAESSIIFNTAPGGGTTPWALGQGCFTAGVGNFGLGCVGAGQLCLKILSTGAVSTPYNFNALSLTSDTITGGATMDIGATSSTINVACGSGVQTLNVGVSGGGATAINLGGSNDTVTLGGTTAANGTLTVSAALGNQIKVFPTVLNAEASLQFNTVTSGITGLPWTAGQGCWGVGAGNFGIGVGNAGAGKCLQITSAGAISTPFSFAATGTVTGSNITTMTSDIAANKATLTAATSSATASTLAMRGAASECSFGALTASTVQLTTGAGASKVLTSDASGNGTWQTPTATSAVTMGGNVTGSSGSCSVVGAASGFAVAGTMSSSGAATLGGLILPTTGGTASTLSYYEDSYSWTFNIIGPFSGTLSVNALITRVGNIVSIRLPTNLQTIAAVSTQPFQPATSGDYIPARFRPTVFAVYSLCACRDNSTNVSGLYVGLTSGSFQIGTFASNGASFTNSGNAGVLPTLIQYCNQ